jgi:hypothetical protein
MQKSTRVLEVMIRMIPLGNVFSRFYVISYNHCYGTQIL